MIPNNQVNACFTQAAEQRQDYGITCLAPMTAMSAVMAVTAMSTIAFG